MITEGERVDAVLLALGGWKSKYHHFHNTVMILSSFSTTFQLLCLIFIGKMVPHQCAAPTNISQWNNISDVPSHSIITYNQCGIDIVYNDTNRVVSHQLPCIFGMKYSERKDVSIITEFDLVCDKESLGDPPQTLLILGQGIGALTIPTLSDRFGRRPTHLISHVIFLVLSVAITFVPHYISFAVLRLLLGIVQQGIVLTSVTYSVEIFPSQYRRVIGFLGTLSWTLAAMAMTPIGYFLRNESWRTLQLIFSTVSIHVIIQIIFMDESFRWLIANRRYEQALINLKKAIEINKSDEELIMEKFEILIGSMEVIAINSLQEDEDDEEIEGDVTENLNKDDQNNKLDSRPVEKITLWDVMKIRRLSVIVLIFWFIWCTSAMSYFGLTFTSTSLFGDPYLNIFLSLSMELPPCFMYLFFVERWGRRITSQIFFGLVGVGLLLATIINTTTEPGNTASAVFVTIFTMIGKIGATGAFSIVFFYTPEVFATNVRNVGLGSSSIAARVGGMVAPFSRMLSYYIPWGPGVIFGSMSVLATILLRLLPETKGRQLPQTLDDMVQLYVEEGDTTVFSVKVNNSNTSIAAETVNISDRKRL